VTAKLTAQQQRFVDEYLADPELNATRAYRKAYPSCRTDAAANAAASRLLASVKVKAAIAQAQAERTKRTQVGADRVVGELALLAFSSIENYTIDDEGKLKPADGVPSEVLRAIEKFKIKKRIIPGMAGAREIEAEIKLWSKPAALKMLGEHVGVFDKATPLEKILDALPQELGRAIREALGRDVPGEGSAASSDPPRSTDEPGPVDYPVRRELLPAPAEPLPPLADR
jgi:phage terminase small subunit